MPLSPVCLVRGGTGSFAPTINGVNVVGGASVSIKLADTTGVGNWFLQVIGTDELSSTPTLVGVNNATHQVADPSTVVTLVFPTGSGRALGFRSEVAGTGGPISTTFGVYSLTAFETRVGFVTETRESDLNFGWAAKLNPLIRGGGVGGGQKFTTSVVGPGTFQLQLGQVNKYRATVAGLNLRFPPANEGDELQIKESSDVGGTAPNTVTLVTTEPFILVENIGLGGNTPTDTLTEYKTWLKYKYDTTESVWRIVGAAYQLP